jgi:thiol:disulfide interchange protein DsbD
MQRNSTSRLAVWGIAALVVALPAGMVLGQGMETPAVTAGAAVRPASAAPGDVVTVLVTAVIAEGFHIYGLPPVPEMTWPTQLVVLGPAGFVAASETRAPRPTPHPDETQGGIMVDWFTGTVTFAIDVRVPATAEPGTVELTVGLDHMACTEEYCLDATVLETKIPLQITPGKTPAGAAPPAGAAKSGEAGAGAPGPQSLGALVYFAFFGGLASILLPCIYPLIPLTVAFFSKQAGGRAATVRRAVLFCGGIVLTFTVLGALLGTVFNLQDIATSLGLNLFLFLLMVLLALSLFGWFDIRLPSSWTEKMQAAGSGASLAAPIFMGLAFSLASFTCTVAAIGPILAAASTGEMLRPAIGMLAYSTGFALPFFILALFPAWVANLPRGGSWMNTIKVMLGFFEICFAGYYLWRMDLSLNWGVGSWEIVLTLWVVTVFLGGLYLLGKIRLPHDSPKDTITVPSLGLAIVYFAFALYLFGGLMGQVRLASWIQGLLPPRAAVDLMASAPRPEVMGSTDAKFHLGFGNVPWTTDYEHGLAVGEAEGKRILLNFTGIYCTNCRDMETGLLPLPEVVEELRNLVLVELWTDIPNDAVGEKFRTHTTREQSRRYQELRSAEPPEGYGTEANPQYVLLSPRGQVLAEMGYTRDAKAFISFLRTGK